MTVLPNTIVKLNVKNHPGVMSHITGLFSRRGFNLEGILCGPVEGGGESVIYLLVRNDDRLEQIVKQVAKLYDPKLMPGIPNFRGCHVSLQSQWH